MQQPQLAKAARILLILIMAVVILVYAKPFLVPLTFAVILSLLLLPVARWLEAHGVAKALAILLVIIGFLSLFAGLVFFTNWQLSGLAEDTAKMEQQATATLESLRAYISNTFGISPQKQQQILKQQQEGASGQASAFITGFLSGLGTFLTNTLLVLVYIFLMLFFRSHLRTAILKFIPAAQQAAGKKIMHDAQHVTQKYLTGLALMIVSLWVLYGIGFSIVGVKNALFFAVLCGVLEIIPFVGNLAGTVLTLAMAMVQGGSSSMLIGILVTYALVQFVQTYIIEPLVVGSEVNINPLFTIAGIVAGELLWGIPGMILSIPVLGMFKIICDGVEPLQPIGFLIGAPKEKKSKSGFMEKIKSKVK